MKLTKIQQRYNYFQRCVYRLKDCLSRDLKDDIVLTATIKTFEMTFELGWKTIKDILVFKGVSENMIGSRDVIKVAFKNGISLDAPLWLEMLEKRNLVVHDYDGDYSEVVVQQIAEKFFDELAYIAEILKILIYELDDDI